ncbi:hypothetical protein [Heyndrickxia ginsengihumi]|nr:hypothetical protein [Heyndrickxia ginsengihumi]
MIGERLFDLEGVGAGAGQKKSGGDLNTPDKQMFFRQASGTVT